MVLRLICPILLALIPYSLNAEELEKIDITISAFTDSTALKYRSEPVKLNVEIAKTSKDQAQGLMYRKKLKDGHGMLFIFEKPNIRSFWMKNTLIPLSIAFIDSNKTIFQIMDLNPVKTLLQKDVDKAISVKPAKYVLEVPRGWFKNNSIMPGSKLEWSSADIF